jgi:hypothetical protein
MSFPALDLVGFNFRKVIPSSYVTFVEGQIPGYTQQQIIMRTARAYARLRKRYAATIPFGTVPSQPDASGTAPPLVILSGTPTLGSIQIQIGVTLGGSLGIATFQWSTGNGTAFTTGVLTGAAVVLTGTGLTAAFSTGQYTSDNLYVCAAPIPETFLEWIVSGVQVDVLRAHGVNTQDPQIIQVFDREKEVWGPDGEMMQAANSEAGLFDLPDNDKDDATNISSGGPLYYSEHSPYVSADQQEFYGRQEDRNAYNGCGGPPYGSSGGS